MDMENKGGNMYCWLVIALLLCAGIPGYAFAAVPTVSGDALIDGILSTLIYGAVGIALGAISFKVIDALTPGDLRQQLTVEKNVALGIVVGLQALGLSIIIAAAIAG
jgi:uncharacterized membrane protein YjfL (UPF0719 family)